MLLSWSVSIIIGCLFFSLDNSIAESKVILPSYLTTKGLRLIIEFFSREFNIENIIEESTPPLRDVAIFASETSLSFVAFINFSLIFSLTIS